MIKIETQAGFQKCLNMVSLNSSSWRTSFDSVQISGKSSKELKELAQQLIAHSQQLESEEQVSPTGSVGSVNHDPTDPFQDAQDPYSGHDLDSI